MQGFGSPLVFVPLSVLAYATLLDSQRAEAGAILTLVRDHRFQHRHIGGGSMVARSTQVNQSYLVEHFTRYDVERWQATGVVPGANARTSRWWCEIHGRPHPSRIQRLLLLALATLVVLPLVWFVRAR